MGAMEVPCYDLPVRKIRRAGGSLVVSIAVHACRYLGLEPGDWISFWSTYWPGYLLIKKLPADQKGLASRDGRRSHPLMITQVKGTPKAMYVVIPKRICEMLKIEEGDLLVFGWTINEGEFSIVGDLGGRDSEGENNEAKANIPAAISARRSPEHGEDEARRKTRQNDTKIQKAGNTGDRRGC